MHKMADALRLPNYVEVKRYLGKGDRCHVFQAIVDGRRVAIKVYRQEQIKRYSQLYNINIAQYEYDRNLAMYSNPALRSYCAQPIAVIGLDSNYRLSFVQEFVDAIRIEDLFEILGYLPKEITEAGQLIIERACAAGIYDLDLATGNIRVREVENGWAPILHDFNMIPRYKHPNNLFQAFALRTGLKKKDNFDRQFVRNWVKRCEKLSSAASKV